MEHRAPLESCRWTRLCTQVIAAALLLSLCRPSLAQKKAAAPKKPAPGAGRAASASAGGGSAAASAPAGGAAAPAPSGPASGAAAPAPTAKDDGKAAAARTQRAMLANRTAGILNTEARAASDYASADAILSASDIAGANLGTARAITKADIDSLAAYDQKVKSLDANQPALKTDLAAVKQAYTDLNTAIGAAQSALDAANDPAANPPLDPGEADSIKGTIKDASAHRDTLSGLVVNLTATLPDAANKPADRRVKLYQVLGTYAGAIYSRLTDQVKAATLYGVPQDAHAPAIRASMEASLAGLRDVEDERAAVDDAWGKVAADLAITGTDPVKDSQDGLKGAEGTIAGAMAIWVPALVKEADDAAAKGATDRQHARDGMASVPRNTELVGTAKSTQHDLEVLHASELAILADLPALLADYKAIADVKAAIAAAQMLRDSAAKVLVISAAIADVLAGDTERFVADQIRLYYFTDVQRLMKAISPAADLRTTPDIQAAQSAATKSRADLLNEESDIAMLSLEKSQLASRVLEIREDIRKTDAQLADVTNRLQIAQRLAARQAGRRASLDQQSSDLGAQIDNVKMQKQQDQQARDAANSTLQQDISKQDTATKQHAANVAEYQNLVQQQKDLTAKGDTAGAQALQPQIDAASGKLADDNKAIKQIDDSILQDRRAVGQADAKVSGDDAQINRLQKAKDQTDANVAEQQSVSSDLQSQQAELQSQRTNLMNEQAQLPQRLKDANDALFAKQLERARTVRMQMITAEQEAEAFGTARDNQPFWYLPADATSQDPVTRVIVFGYNDSKTILLRGLPADVRRVKDLIAEFDRPAPQARVTLWTLQMSSNSTRGGINSLNHAMTRVDDVLRSLRVNLVGVQDALRKAIVKEVNYVAGVAHLVDGQYQERLARSFFFAPEVRKSLGFDFELPRPRWEAASAYVDLKEAIGLYSVARQQQQWTTFSKGNLEAIKRQRAARTAALLEAYGHFERADQALIYLFAKSPPPYSGFSSVSVPGEGGSTTVISNPREATDYLERAANAMVQLLMAGKPSDANDQSLGKLLSVWSSAVPLAPDGNLQVAKALDTWLFDALQDKNRFIVPSTAYAAPTDELLRDTEYVTKWTLPDPVGTTTLGEMLFVLSLSTRASRDAVLEDFARNISYLVPPEGVTATDIGELERKLPRAFDAEYNEGVPGGISSTVRRALESTKFDNPTSDARYPQFPNAILGASVNQTPGESWPGELTANQLEMLLALTAQTRGNIASEIRYRLREISALSPDDRSGFPGDRPRTDLLPLVGYLYSHGYGHTKTADHTWKQMGLAALHLAGQDLSSMPKLAAADREAWRIATDARDRNSLSKATPRVAAADDMVKRLIVVLEDDLDDFLVAPALQELRRQAMGAGVEVGTLQRESILATNRLVARVDPRANANLSLEGGTDFLNQAQQLAQIVSATEPQRTQRQAERNRKLTSTLPVLGTTGALLLHTPATPAVGIGLLLQLMGDMASQHDTSASVYSINNGNLFKITPIFDPSGQALSFDFDYAATTQVQEPDGSTDPDLSHIERHTVNTRVQLSNLEFREISRYEANSKIGLPEVRSGGLPLLNQMPVLRDIPLIGYYYRRRAQSAERQESLIFAQSSLYPTVGDIVNLLTAVPYHSDLDPEPTAYLAEPGASGTSVEVAAPRSTGPALQIDLPPIQGGLDAVMHVTFDPGNASWPENGVQVNLTANPLDAVAFSPPALTLTASARTKDVIVRTRALSAPIAALVQAKTDRTPVAIQTRALLIQPAAITAFELTQGNSGQWYGHVTLSGPVPEKSAITLEYSGLPAGERPSSAQIVTGQTSSADFTFTLTPGTERIEGTVTAGWGDSVKAARIKIAGAKAKPNSASPPDPSGHAR